MFVGEAPPASDSFFYRGNSGLTNYMRNVLGGPKGDGTPDGTEQPLRHGQNLIWLHRRISMESNTRPPQRHPLAPRFFCAARNDSDSVVQSALLRR
jgi:hypothetical protein